MRYRAWGAAIAAAVILGGTLVSAPATAAPSAGQPIPVTELLEQLRVAAPSTVAFDGTPFSQGIDLDGDGCRTREEVLLEESRIAPTVGANCTIVAGQWLSWWDDATITDPASLDLNLLVSPKEAWVSGAWSWTAAQRRAFANDTDDPRTLSMVSPAVASAKGDKDFASWLPSFVPSRCTYVGHALAVKWRWNLSIDPAEKAAAQSVLAGCGAASVLAPQLPADRPADPPVGPEETKYYVTKYDGTVWAVTSTSVVPLTYAQWQAAGFPTPAPAPTDYVKYPWSSTISAVTIFGKDQARWVWRHVTLGEWNRAGRPAPRTAGWIKDSVYYQWAGSNQIFVQDVGGVKHALTYAEWQASGFQPYTPRTNQGFVKLSWDNSIAFLSDFSGGKGGPIGFAQWQAEGFPRPTVASRFPGDQLYKFNGEKDIWYAGPTVNRTISYAEWGAAGYGAPAIRHISRVSDFTCPAWAPIKGNASSRIYHVPGGRYYNATNPEECFRSEAAAVGAGYRRSQL